MPKNQAARDELIEQVFPVLDHGHVVLLDVMGDDEAIANAARTSYKKQGKKAKTDKENRGLIRHLLRNRHTTPFEMAELKFHVKLPIFVERQCIRHRTASTNEMSGRYSELPEEYYVPVPESVCAQSTTNKQGRAEPIPRENAEHFIDSVRHYGEDSFKEYRMFLNKDNIAKELARIALPVGTYTEKVWKIDLHNLMHFLGLRMDAHAQWEVRQFANVMGDMVAKLFPMCWEAFLDFRLNSMSLSALDIRQLQAMAGCKLVPQVDFYRYAIPEWRNMDEDSTERKEFMVKAVKLGVLDIVQNFPPNDAYPKPAPELQTAAETKPDLKIKKK